MITALEERKINLLSQIEKLKREIDILRRAQYKKPALFTLRLQR